MGRRKKRFRRALDEQEAPVVSVAVDEEAASVSGAVDEERMSDSGAVDEESASVSGAIGEETASASSAVDEDIEMLVSDAADEDGTDVPSNVPRVKKTSLRNAGPRRAGPYACKVCNRTFRRKAILQSHLRIHEVVETFDCLKCDRQFTSQYEFDFHVASHAPKFKCNWCNKKYLYERILIKHQEMSHGFTPDKQNTKKATEEDDKKASSHTQTAPVEDKARVQSDFKVRSPLQSYLNGQARINFNQRTQKHPGIMDLFYCPKCERIISHKLNATNHVFPDRTQGVFTVCPCHTCRNDPTQSVTETSPPQKTQLPSETETTLTDEHTLSDSSNDSQAKDAEDSDPLSIEHEESPKKKPPLVTDKQFLCFRCGKLFDSENLLGDHMKEHLQCGKCRTVFNTSEALEEHVKTLGAEKLLACCLCRAILHGKRELRRHINEHLQDERCQSLLSDLRKKRELTKVQERGKGSDVKTPSASKAKHRPKLKISKVTHSGENKLKCSQCGKNVPLRHGFDEHIQTDKVDGKPQTSDSGEEFVYISWCSHPLMSKKEAAAKSYCKCKPDIENLLVNDTQGPHHSSSTGDANSSTVIRPVASQSVGTLKKKPENFRLGLSSVFSRSFVEVINDAEEQAATDPLAVDTTTGSASTDTESDGAKPGDTEDHSTVKKSNSPISLTEKKVDNSKCLLVRVSTQDKDSRPVPSAVSSPGFLVKLVNSGTETQSATGSGSLQSRKELSGNTGSSSLTTTTASQSSAGKMLTSKASSSSQPAVVVSQSSAGKVLTGNAVSSSSTSVVTSQSSSSKMLSGITISSSLSGAAASQSSAGKVLTASTVSSSVASPTTAGKIFVTSGTGGLPTNLLSRGPGRAFVTSTGIYYIVDSKASQGRDKTKVARILKDKVQGSLASLRRFGGSPLASNALFYIATPQGVLIPVNQVVRHPEKGSASLQDVGKNVSTKEAAKPIKTEINPLQSASDGLGNVGGRSQGSPCPSQELATTFGRREEPGGGATGTTFVSVNEFEVKREPETLDEMDTEAEDISNTSVKSEVFDLDIDIKEEWDITWV